MKTKLLLALGLLFPLLVPSLSHADQKPELFGVQKNAMSPFSSKEGTLLAVSDEETDGFQLWDVATRRSLWKSDDYILAMTDDETAVLVAHGGHPINNELRDLKGVQFRLLNARSGHVLRQWDAPKNQDGETDKFLDFNWTEEDGKFTVATQKYLYLYNINQKVLQSHKWISGDVSTRLQQARFVEDTNQILAFDGTLGLFDAVTGVQLRRFPANPASKLSDQSNTTLDVSPDQFSFVEDPYDDSNSLIFRMSDGKLLWRAANWPTFSADGKLAYVSTGMGINVFDAHTGRKLRNFSGPQDPSFDVSNDGKWLYEARDGKIYRWQLPVLPK